MPTNIANARVLFVDDDESFLDLISQVFSGFSEGAWQIHLATSAAQSLDILRRQPVDLAVLDLRMPGVDGLQLLGTLNREFPGLQKVFLTGIADEYSRITGLEGGAALFLEKPASLAGMESIFATLNELARWQQKQGERGVMRGAGLQDIIRMECLSGNSRLIEITAGLIEGRIYIKDGAIIHAATEGYLGRPAFTRLVNLPDAEFRLKEFDEPSQRSIEQRWELLILEAARPEERMMPPLGISTRPAAAVPPSEVESKPPPVWPAPPAAPASVLAVSVKMPSRPALVPPIQMAPVVKETPRPLTPAPASFLPEPDSAGLHIEEMLVCTEQREVLHEWQCQEMDKRVVFMEFVLTKSRQLAQKLPLGKFDRLELQSPEGRTVVHWPGHCGILVRSNTKSQPPTASGIGVSHPIDQWLDWQTHITGVLAYGVVHSGKKTFNQSCAADYSPIVLDGAWRCAEDTYETARRQNFPAWQLRWIYERAQLFCLRRADGVFLGIFLGKDPQAVDLAGVGRLFNNFKLLRVSSG